jgi:hypothetical protein
MKISLAITFRHTSLRGLEVASDQDRSRFPDLRPQGDLYRVAIKRQLFADAGFTVKLQIPLNPPLKKGDFKEAAVFPPLFSRGVGGIFLPGIDQPQGHEPFVCASPGETPVSPIYCDSVLAPHSPGEKPL